MRIVLCFAFVAILTLSEGRPQGFPPQSLGRQRYVVSRQQYPPVQVYQSNPYQPDPYRSVPYRSGPYPSAPYQTYQSSPYQIPYRQALYRPVYHAPARSYNNYEQGASSKNWDSAGGQAYNDQDIRDGYGSGQVTSDNSGWRKYRGDNSNSLNKYGDSKSVDRYGAIKNNDYHEDRASAEKEDSITGNARQRGQFYGPGGQNYQVYDHGSDYGNKYLDTQASANVGDYTNNRNPDGTFYQSNYANNGASTGRVADKYDNAFQRGEIVNGGDSQKYDLGSLDHSRQDDGASSFYTDLDAARGDPFNIQTTRYRGRGADKYANDIRNSGAHNIQDISTDYGRNGQQIALSSLDRSADTNDESSRSDDNSNTSDGQDGSHSKHTYTEGASTDINSDADSVATAADNRQSDFGRQTQNTFDQSMAASANKDAAQSNVDRGNEAGNDKYGKYNLDHDNSGASKAITADTSESNVSKGAITDKFGLSKQVWNTGDNNFSTKGNTDSSNKNQNSGQVVGKEGTHVFKPLN